MDKLSINNEIIQHINQKLIYECADGVTYAREFGADPSTRRVVESVNARDPRTYDGRPLHDHLMEDKLWVSIRRLAKTNPTLQAELDRVIMLYHLINDNG